MRQYHTLLSREKGGKWAIEFGDYSAAVVRQERSDQMDADDGRKFKIITTNEDQASIDAAVKELNR